MSGYERALREAADPNDLAVGEAVQVITRMGRHVADGVITQMYTTGAVQIRTSDRPDEGGLQSSGDSIYDAALYLFLRVDPNEDAVEESAPKSDTPKPSGRDSGASVGARVDIDALPTAIKQKVIGISALDAEQADRVMSAVSDALLKALKSVGVRDSDVYQKVAEFQKAVKPVLGK